MQCLHLVRFMRNPLRKAGFCLAVGLPAAGGLVLATHEYDRLGETARTIIGVICLPVAVLSFVILLMCLFAALGHARLMGGKGVIARWHVTASEWDRFRAFDAIRSAQDATLFNELGIRERTPAEGVEVVVGRRQLIVDGSYHALIGMPSLSAVYWLPAPAEPECLEFALVYPRGRYGGTWRVSLRVPVPAASREAGVRLYWHYHASIPKPQPGLVFRRPRLVFGWCIGLAAVAAAIGGGASFMSSRFKSSPFIADLAVIGIATAVTALIVTFILAFGLWLRRSRTSTDA